ncbi:unnamed protein product [Rotaria sordida]|uniref:Uncharacterized protein n=1 Tax=Rotaria sordida TaxID=392033 RepID=A0A814JH95_9BILA|nr:unnamed protein product [Rotaria sordida]CAF1035512.1 unnamed protein product [Rotaria sordida]
MEDQNNVKKPLLPPTLPRWWRVLLPLSLIVIISTIDKIVLNDFIEYRYTIYYGLNSSSTQNNHELCLNASRRSHYSTASILLTTTTPKYPISTTLSPNEQIQASNAHLNVLLSLAATVPSILISILLGANCDRIGRKSLVALPFIGKSIRYVILTFVAYYDLSNIWIILSVIFDGIFGTAALSILSSFAYVTDCTNEKKRTSMGIYLQHPRYVQLMIFTLLLSVSGFIFCIFFQPESKLNVQHLNMFQQLKQCEFQTIAKSFRVFSVKRKEHKQRSLLMLVSIHLLSIIMLLGNMSINFLYLYGAPFCFDSFGVSLNNSVQIVTTVLLTIPFTLFIAKRTDHLLLPMLGCLAYITQLILFGIAPKNWILHLAAGIGGILYVLIPIIRSRITKLVEPDEYAVVFILASVVESGGYYAISALTNEIYQLSLSFYPGLVFFCLAIVGVITIILMSILYILEYRPAETEKTLSLNE